MGLVIVHHLILKSHLKNEFLISEEEDTFVINCSFVAPEKKIDIDFSKAKIKFCLSLHYDGDKSYSFVNGIEIYKFKASNKNNNFPSQFCLGSISNKFDNVNSKEISFKGNMYSLIVMLLINHFKHSQIFND